MSAVKLVWITPNAEQLISDMARVSAPENQGLPPGKLLAYCVRNAHWSIFEMVDACIEIETTRDIARQILRHRSFSFQEFSQRYAEVDKLPLAPLREARLQDHKNRQNSIETQDAELQAWWNARQERVRDEALDAYQEALNEGIAKEVARAVLPEGLTTSRMYMKGNLRSWMHFVQLRSGNGTQKECAEIAQAIGDLLAAQFPLTWEALQKPKEIQGEKDITPKTPLLTMAEPEKAKRGRPLALSPQDEAVALALLDRGTPRMSVALVLGVSEHTIRRLVDRKRDTV